MRPCATVWRRQSTSRAGSAGSCSCHWIASTDASSLAPGRRAPTGRPGTRTPPSPRPADAWKVSKTARPKTGGTRSWKTSAARDARVAASGLKQLQGRYQPRQIPLDLGASRRAQLDQNRGYAKFPKPHVHAAARGVRQWAALPADARRWPQVTARLSVGARQVARGTVTRPKHEAARAVIVDDERGAVHHNPFRQRLGFLLRKCLGPAESDAEHGIRVECV